MRNRDTAYLCPLGDLHRLSTQLQGQRTLGSPLLSCAVSLYVITSLAQLGPWSLNTEMALLSRQCILRPWPLGRCGILVALVVLGWKSWVLVHFPLSPWSVGGIGIIFHSKGLYPFLCHSNIFWHFSCLKPGGSHLGNSPEVLLFFLS